MVLHALLFRFETRVMERGQTERVYRLLRNRQYRREGSNSLEIVQFHYSRIREDPTIDGRTIRNKNGEGKLEIRELFN